MLLSKRMIVGIVLLLMVLSTVDTSGSQYARNLMINQGPADVETVGLELDQTQVELGDQITAQYSFQDVSQNPVANISYLLYLLPGNTTVTTEELQNNSTLLLNSTSTGDIESSIIDTVLVQTGALTPNNYTVYLTTNYALMGSNVTNINTTASFELFPHQGSRLETRLAYGNFEIPLFQGDVLSLDVNTTEIITGTMFNAGSGNALDVSLEIESIDFPLEVVSSFDVIELPSLGGGDWITFNFTVTNPNFGIADIRLVTRYSTELGANPRRATVLPIHTIPSFVGILSGPFEIESRATAVPTGEFEVELANLETTSFNARIRLVSNFISFTPPETPLLEIVPGVNEIDTIFVGVPNLNGTAEVSLIVTYIDPEGSEELEIEADTIEVLIIGEVDISPTPPWLSIIALTLYGLTAVAIIVLIIRKDIRDLFMERFGVGAVISDLTYDKSSVIVDGSNVAWEDLSTDGRPQIKNILKAVETLKRHGFKEITVVTDAALRYQIKDTNDLDKEVKNGLIKVLPAKVDGDSFILRLSRDLGALILTNDLYKEYRKEFKWIDRRRIPYSILNDKFYLHPIYDLPSSSNDDSNSSTN